MIIKIFRHLEAYFIIYSYNVHKESNAEFNPKFIFKYAFYAKISRSKIRYTIYFVDNCKQDKISFIIRLEKNKIIVLLLQSMKDN